MRVYGLIKEIDWERYSANSVWRAVTGSESVGRGYLLPMGRFRRGGAGICCNIFIKDLNEVPGISKESMAEEGLLSPSCHKYGTR